eukprot:2397863-Pyramimonas_sp.AAC.1
MVRVSADRQHAERVVYHIDRATYAVESVAIYAVLQDVPRSLNAVCSERRYVDHTMLVEVPCAHV